MFSTTLIEHNLVRMMISVVVVYNNKHIFNSVLMRSLKDQTAEFELISLDNTRGEFKSASEALNYGGLRATGRYIMFVHQDVDLGIETWLEEVEKILDGIPDLGIAGVAGMSEAGRSFAERQRGHISNSGEIWGREMEKEEEVQTLDELLLIIPRSQFEKTQFDEKTFDHWHCYGADYCLSVKRAGLKAYVIPAFVYHRSTSANIKILEFIKEGCTRNTKDILSRSIRPAVRSPGLS
ncbi:glycosyltransferase [Methanothrix harundinacea]|uniref:Glycosyl transferase family 2 n=1 Tax=Methanothrix harundinacea (strain 6Ac) TaxID=1110509 RepID=G7WR61_METH6|nr:glycosyltransferase [Methanothrix harundinacea]AET65364.1 Glycosyl transferase family 2 [Methanothrix harundinacea 6Ac]